MKTPKKGNVQVIKHQKAKLKVKEKEQNRRKKPRLETNDIKPTRNRENKSMQNISKHSVCQLCRRLKTGKHVHKLGKAAKGRNAKRTQDIHKFRKYLSAVFLSTFNAVVPSCISYMA